MKSFENFFIWAKKGLTLSVSQKTVRTKNEAIKVRVIDVRLVKFELGFLLLFASCFFVCIFFSSCIFVCVLLFCLRFVFFLRRVFCCSCFAFLLASCFLFAFCFFLRSVFSCSGFAFLFASCFFVYVLYFCFRFVFFSCVCSAFALY